MYQKFQASLLFTGNQLLSGDSQVLITKEDGTIVAILPVSEAGDGIQHFEPRSVFGGEVEYKSQIDRDKRKDEYCISNNIKIIFLS